MINREFNEFESSVATIVEDLKARAFKGGAMLLVRQVVTKVIGVIANILLARLLIPEQFGVYSIVSSAVGLFSLMGDVGLGASLVQQHEEPTPDDEATIFTAQQICVAIPSVLVLLFAPLIASNYKFSDDTVWLIRFIAISGIVSSFGSISRIRLEREMVFGPLAVIETVRSIVFQAVAVGMAFAGGGVWSFALASVLSQLSAVILSEKYSPWKIRWMLNREILKKRMGFGLSYQSLNLFGFAKDAVSPFFIGTIYGAGAVGLIGFAISQANYPTLFASVFHRLYFPAFSRCQNDPESLTELIETVLWWNNLIVIGITAILFPLIPILVPAVFGQKWVAAIPLTYMLTLANLTLGCSLTITALANALGKPDVTLRYYAFLAVANWFLVVPLVMTLGINGYGIAQIILSLTNFMFFRSMQKHAKFRLMEPLTPFLVAFAINSALIIWLLKISNAHDIWAICFFGLIGLLTFLFISNLCSRGKLVRIIKEMLALYRK
ncbi:oligosaccharide flippase family protein [soil metagenome]